MFRGSLSTERPPKATYSGYCAIRSHIKKVTIVMLIVTMCVTSCNSLRGMTMDVLICHRTMPYVYASEETGGSLL